MGFHGNLTGFQVHARSQYSANNRYLFHLAWTITVKIKLAYVVIAEPLNQSLNSFSSIFL